MTHRRSHQLDRLAKIYDAEILPLWSERFGRLLLRGLTLPPKAMVLDVGTGTGYPALEVLRRMDDAGRVVSIDPASAMLDVAREKAGQLGGRRIFFRSESAEPRLSFAADVFDLVLSNLALADMDDPGRAIADFARVTKPGGRVVVTLPLAGTFDEFHDLFREALLQLDRADALARFDAYLGARPDPAQLRRWLVAAGLGDVTVEHEEYRLLFRSSREFFFAPIIERGPLIAWKQVAGQGAAMQEVFLRVKASIDTYFAGRPFGVTVRAGCASGRRLTDEEQRAAAASQLPADANDGPTDKNEMAAVERVDATGSSSVGELDADLELVEDGELDEVLGAETDILPPDAHGARSRH